LVGYLFVFKYIFSDCIKDYIRKTRNQSVKNKEITLIKNKRKLRTRKIYNVKNKKS